MLTSAGISPRTAEWMVTMIKLSLDWEDPLEEETVTHSSILAWRIPWTEELGGLQPVELQRVGRTQLSN